MARYRLYGWKQTGSMAPEAALEELGAPYDAIPVSRETDANLLPGFLAINPRGQLPALVMPDGTVVTEGPAILTHLGDAFPAAGMIPAAGSSARATHDRWMAFCQANIYEGMLRQYYSDRYTADPAGVAGVKAAADDYVDRHFALLDAALTGEGPFLFGARLSMVDIYVWMLCYWLDEGKLHALWHRVARLFDAADARPALRGVAARHFG
jgi:glutathione S-transferase